MDRVEILSKAKFGRRINHTTKCSRVWIFEDLYFRGWCLSPISKILIFADFADMTSVIRLEKFPILTKKWGVNHKPGSLVIVHRW